MNRLFTKFFVVVGLLATIVVLIWIFGKLVSFVVKDRVPGVTILEVNLEQDMLEYLPNDPVALFMMEDKTTIRDVVEALEKAADDERVVGLVAHIGASGFGFARAQEIRDAVLAFRKKGKMTVAFSETFGEFSYGNGGYYLATAFEEIYLQPSGDIGLVGLLIEHPFLRGIFEKLGIEPHMDQRYEYKNAMNLYTEKKFTDAHREATETLMNSLFNQMVKGIAESRNLSEEEVKALINRGPFLGQEAVDAKLVDGLGYRDEIYEKVKEKAGEDAELLYLGAYLNRAGHPHTDGETIALIYGVGGIQRGESEYDPVSDDFIMGSASVTAAFRAAIKDEDVKAILFRIDCPGGSYVASDAVWREVVRAKEAGKPVIVSMGNVAASGGYFVSMAATKIVAQPGTITGSIGVLAGKMLTSGFWDKIGLSWDHVQTSAHATMWTGLNDYTPGEWARFQNWLDRIYDDFTGKVADGRSIPKEKILEIAKGRVWSGETAKELGLVDELGGYATALRLAKDAANIPEEEDVHIKVFPKSKSRLEALFAESPSSSEGEAALQTLKHLIREIQPVMKTAKKMGLAGETGVLMMPEIEVK